MNLNDTYRKFLGFELQASFNAEQTAIGLANFDKLTSAGKHPERAFATIHSAYGATDTKAALAVVKEYIAEKQEPRTVNGHLIEAFRQMENRPVNDHQQRQLDTLRATIAKHNARVDKLVGVKLFGHEFTADDAERVKISTPKVAMRTERFEAHASLPASKANTPLGNRVKGCEVTVTLLNNR